MNKTSLSEILEKVYSKLSKEISEAYYNDSIDDCLKNMVCKMKLNTIIMTQIIRKS